MNFKELCKSIRHSACVVSVEKTKGGYGEIRIVDGNDSYLNSFKTENYTNHVFVPNSLYTEYLDKNLNFEEYAYRAAVKKELLHSYAYPENFKAWMHMLFIPLEYETEELSYCMYIMEISEIFNPELLAHPSGDIYNKVLNTTLQLANTGDFKMSLRNVTKEIRKICNALFSCILLVDDSNKELDILAEDREPGSDRKTMGEYMGPNFYDIVKSWDDLVAKNGNCIIISDQKGMDYIKENNPEWYATLEENRIRSLVLFPIKSGNNPLGYMWVSNFMADDTPKIKEALEITTFVLGSQIGNHLLLDQLTKLSSIDQLTGLFNRNKLNLYMGEVRERENTTTGLLFLDINGLKRVNDNEGHLAGDNLIKRAASVLRKVFKGHDIYRVGGDEFVVIMENTEEQKVVELIEELHRKEKEKDVSFSVGYSMNNNHKDVEKALIKADLNMYNDKRKFYGQ